MPERGANIASLLDALKAQPLMLGLLLVIFSLIGFVYLQSSQFNQQRADNVKLFVQIQGEVQKLLSQCVIPAPK
jgi:membrane-anchored glycerophosphoryl diester phosphodiesterase (GDPDase)